MSGLSFDGDCAHGGVSRSYCVTCLRQALWDVYAALGGDTDGDRTPAAIVSDLCQHVIDTARESRAEFDALLMADPPEKL